jgi:hypothetical protein
MLKQPDPRLFAASKEQWQGQLIADHKITAATLKVAITISFYFNRDEFKRGNGLVAFPGIVKLARVTGLVPRTVIRAIQWLEARGHFSVKRRRVGKKNEANRYHPLFKTTKQLNEVPPREAKEHVTTLVTKLGHHPSDQAMPPEPLTEPLTQPLTPCKYMASSDDDASNKSKTASQEKEEERGLPTRSADAQLAILERHLKSGRRLDRHSFSAWHEFLEQIYDEHDPGDPAWGRAARLLEEYFSPDDDQSQTEEED